MIELIIVVAAVILTSAMCSLFEAVLYSVPISHIETLARETKPLVSYCDACAKPLTAQFPPSYL